MNKKKLHSSNSGSTFAQTIDYKYNHRGWLKESNAPLFKQYLKYEDIIAGVKSQYNGNISQQLWNHGSEAQKSYTYTYDDINRLTKGTMSGDIGREALTYDKMGNILTLKRTGTSLDELDDLSYTYAGNRLTQVVDGKPNTTAKYHLPGTTAYTHDANGNMTSRLNTAQPGNNITAIRYNHLNLPESVSASGGTLTYVYEASGRKLRSTQSGTTTDYIDGIEWEGTALSLLHMEEGRITKSGATYTYEYFLKDHLGNNRSGFKAASPATASFRSDYYPFGLQYQEGIVVSSPENKYLYNGKELQTRTGMLDYGARQNDPVIGRWNVVDPLAEAYERFLPYNCTVDDPVDKLHPNGMWVTTINRERTEDPDEIAQLLAELKQTELNDDKKKKARDADKSGCEKESSALGRNSTQGNSDSWCRCCV